MDDILLEKTRALLKDAGHSGNIKASRLLGGGRNNRTYRIDAEDGTVLLKHYSHDAEWDRAATESRFLLFCSAHGIDRVPTLLAEDRDNELALHSWIEGRRPALDAISNADMTESALFLDALILASQTGDAPTFSPARDAALCFEDFFRSPRERLVALHAALRANPAGDFVPEALSFYETLLWPAWERAEAVARSALADEDLARPFPANALFVSPSDFGFHNTLRTAGGGLAFLDFEYAGLDSPLKAMMDFVCQADYRLPAKTVDVFSPDPDRATQMRALLPLARIKFCCIILNEFKIIDRQRRMFAGRCDYGMQLEKAIRYYSDTFE